MADPTAFSTERAQPASSCWQLSNAESADSGTVQDVSTREPFFQRKLLSGSLLLRAATGSLLNCRFIKAVMLTTYCALQVMINSGLEDIPRTQFSYDFEYEQQLIRRLQSEQAGGSSSVRLAAVHSLQRKLFHSIGQEVVLPCRGPSQTLCNQL